MKYLITGGAGFIGANYINYVQQAHPDCSILCVDAFTYAANISSLKNAMRSPSFKVEKLDITDREGIFRIIGEYRPDVVVNFAAETHVDRSIKDPGIFLSTNILGTQVLMDACLRYKTKRFHQVSTDEVYGDLPLDRADLLFTESTSLAASSPYSASKAGADLLVHSYFRTFGLPASISRCSNNYGPYQFPEKLIPLMISRADSEESLPVYGDGKNVRDWLHVHDHCRAIDLIIEKGEAGEVYNIGGNSERSNLDVVKIILDTMNKPHALITFVKDRPGHDRRYAIDFSKIQHTLGWRPHFTFEDGIAQTIDWYRENKAWWHAIINGKYKDYYLEMYGNRG